MNENEKTMPYYAFDGAMMMANKTIRRLWIMCILLIILLVGSNLAWLIYERQFEDTVTTKIEQEAEWEDDSNVIFNGTGTVSYGESKADSDSN